MPWTLTTSRAILFKAGANFNSTAGTSGAILELISDLAEGAVCRDTKFDWVTNYSAVKTVLKPTLSDVASDIGAKFLISHDMAGYTGLGEATTMINVLLDNYANAIRILSNQDVQAFARS